MSSPTLIHSTRASSRCYHQRWPHFAAGRSHSVEDAAICLGSRTARVWMLEPQLLWGWREGIEAPWSANNKEENVTKTRRGTKLYDNVSSLDTWVCWPIEAGVARERELTFSDKLGSTYLEYSVEVSGKYAHSLSSVRLSRLSVRHIRQEKSCRVELNKLFGRSLCFRCSQRQP